MRWEEGKEKDCGLQLDGVEKVCFWSWLMVKGLVAYTWLSHPYPGSSHIRVREGSGHSEISHGYQLRPGREVERCSVEHD